MFLFFINSHAYQIVDCVVGIIVWTNVIEIPKKEKKAKKQVPTIYLKLNLKLV